MSKRIVFMGAGAVGGYVGGHFARTGEGVTLSDPWPEHIEYIKPQGSPSARGAEPVQRAGGHRLHLYQVL